MWDLRQPACRRVDPLRNQKSPNYVRGDCHLFHRPPVKMPRIPCGFPVRSEEHAFEVNDPRFSTDHPGCFSGSVGRSGLRRSWTVVSECHRNCPQRDRRGLDSVPVDCGYRAGHHIMRLWCIRVSARREDRDVEGEAGMGPRAVIATSVVLLGAGSGAGGSLGVLPGDRG